MRIKTLDDLKNPKMREQARRDTEPSSLQPQVEKVLRQRKAKPEQPKRLDFTLELRPRALKNSRESRGKHTVVNEAAAARLEQAKWHLNQQYKGEPLTGPYALFVTCWYSDGRSHLDADAVLTFCMDALKGVVITDDSPKHLPDVAAKSRLSRVGKDTLEITLTEVV
jgi:Holliday junction resolvase RusA-like endonuclease